VFSNIATRFYGPYWKPGIILEKCIKTKAILKTMLRVDDRFYLMKIPIHIYQRLVSLIIICSALTDSTREQTWLWNHGFTEASKTMTAIYVAKRLVGNWQFSFPWAKGSNSFCTNRVSKESHILIMFFFVFIFI